MYTYHFGQFPQEKEKEDVAQLYFSGRMSSYNSFGSFCNALLPFCLPISIEPQRFTECPQLSSTVITETVSDYLFWGGRVQDER
jgi:hypothetical protein